MVAGGAGRGSSAPASIGPKEASGACRMVTTNFAVVGHPARFERAVSLAAEDGAELFLDTAGLGEWGNHARAWDWLAGSGASWVVVLQDDAVPVPGLRQRLAEVMVSVAV